MATSLAGKFSCDTCGRAFRWKLALAGRKVKCPCGAVMICPMQDEPDSLYALAPIAAIPVAAVPAPALVYRDKQKDPSALDLHFPNRVMDLYAPLGLIAGSIVVWLIAVGLFASTQFPFTMVLRRIGLEMLIETSLMLVGVSFAAKWREISFCPFWSAILKLAAISLAPQAVMMLMILPLAFIPFGGLIVWLIGFGIYFALIGALFELDSSDTWFCVLVIFIVRMACLFVLAFSGLGRIWL